jgi:hypothetical protein
MEYVNAEIASLPRKSNPTVTTAAFNRARDLANKEKAYTAKEMESGAWKKSGKYALVAGGPATVIPGAAGGSQAQPAGAARLSKAALGVDDPLVFYNGNAFSISYPRSWRKGEGQNGSVALVPPDGASQAGIAYGAIVEGARFQAPVNNANDLQQATTAIAQQMSQQNEGMMIGGNIQSTTINGRPAATVELRGRSPLSNRGTALPERDLLVTISRPDGAVNYIVFVAPEPDYATLKPLYTRMLQSFRVR